MYNDLASGQIQTTAIGVWGGCCGGSCCVSGAPTTCGFSRASWAAAAERALNSAARSCSR